ncbi:hypothetical protein HDU92_002547 [Lobulomyces angularis]|nr:hypothetical protein HDU92_002547 [Lobulomyces angularis]
MNASISIPSLQINDSNDEMFSDFKEANSNLLSLQRPYSPSHSPISSPSNSLNYFPNSPLLSTSFNNPPFSTLPINSQMDDLDLADDLENFLFNDNDSRRASNISASVPLITTSSDDFLFNTPDYNNNINFSNSNLGISNLNVASHNIDIRRKSTSDLKSENPFGSSTSPQSSFNDFGFANLPLSKSIENVNQFPLLQENHTFNLSDYDPITSDIKLEITGVSQQQNQHLNNNNGHQSHEFDLDLLLASYPNFNINNVPISPTLSTSNFPVSPTLSVTNIPLLAEQQGLPDTSPQDFSNLFSGFNTSNSNNDDTLPGASNANNNNLSINSNAGSKDLLSPQSTSGPLRRRKSRSGTTSPTGEKTEKLEATHQCPVPDCNKLFTRRGNMMAHLRTHDPNRERNFICQICQKSFCRPHDLQRHSSVHTGIKAFHCPICQKSFTRRDAIRRHGDLSGCYQKDPSLFD